MSITLRFNVLDDSGGDFQVTFTRKDDNLTASCSCPEGRTGGFCEHRVRLMSGGKDCIASDNKDDLLTLQSILRGTDVGAAFFRYVNATEALRVAEISRNHARDALAKAMLD